MEGHRRSQFFRLEVSDGLEIFGLGNAPLDDGVDDVIDVAVFAFPVVPFGLSRLKKRSFN